MGTVKRVCKRCGRIQAVGFGVHEYRCMYCGEINTTPEIAVDPDRYALSDSSHATELLLLNLGTEMLLRKESLDSHQEATISITSFFNIPASLSQEDFSSWIIERINKYLAAEYPRYCLADFKVDLSTPLRSQTQQELTITIQKKPSRFDSLPLEELAKQGTVACPICGSEVQVGPLTSTYCCSKCHAYSTRDREEIPFIEVNKAKRMQLVILEVKSKIDDLYVKYTQKDFLGIDRDYDQLDNRILTLTVSYPIEIDEDTAKEIEQAVARKVVNDSRFTDWRFHGSIHDISIECKLSVESLKTRKKNYLNQPHLRNARRSERITGATEGCLATLGCFPMLSAVLILLAIILLLSAL